MTQTLLRKPVRAMGKVHDITPASAGWDYVGFAVHTLNPGDAVEEVTGDREVVLVVVDGKVALTAGGIDLGLCGDRMSVFEWIPPHAVYVPVNARWTAAAETACTLAVCSAPGRDTGRLPLRLGPEGIPSFTRGVGSNLRHIQPIAMEERDVADSLLVTETLTPAGNWSSHPPHRHDEDHYPEITYLEETYYHRYRPSQGFGFQRVFTEDGVLDETLTVQDGEVVLVPKGHHPCGAIHGYDMYYLNVMAGPRRTWKIKLHPDHAWIAERDWAA